MAMNLSYPLATRCLLPSAIRRKSEARCSTADRNFCQVRACSSSCRLVGLAHIVMKHDRPPSGSRPFIRSLTLLCVPSVGRNSMQAAQAGNQTIWKQVYREALFELEPQLLQSKLQAAQSAVDARLFGTALPYRF